MIPFDPSTPLYLGATFLGGACVVGGGQSFFVYCGRCALIKTKVLNNFFLIHGPSNQRWGCRVQTPGTLP